MPFPRARRRRDRLGRLGSGCLVGVGAADSEAIGNAATGSVAGSAGGVGQDEAGGGLGGVGEQFGQDAGVRVRGQHDAGVSEQRLDGLEVSAGGQGEAGRAVSQVVQPDRW
jgi:hypothetical protein